MQTSVLKIKKSDIVSFCVPETTISQRSPLLTLLSAYCLTILMHCGRRCRQRLYATAGDSDPPCIGSAKVLTFFFVFTAILIPKKRKETKIWMTFSAEK